MNKLRFVLVSLFLISAAYSQQFDLGDYAVQAAFSQFKASKVIPPSPDAASLGTFGNIPVSLFTGSPQVAVPLTSIGSRIPTEISLTYNNSGFRPGDVAAWVGLGWTLNAGGVVTRSVLGNPDISENYYGVPPVTLPSNDDLFARYDLINTMRSGAVESQPDVFFYNVGSFSGKFYIKQDQSITTKIRSNVKITHCITCLPESSWFEIVDEQGNRYEFKAVEVSSTITDVSIPQGVVAARTTYTYPSSWYLTKITSPDGVETIEFEYLSTGQHVTISSGTEGKSITYSKSVTTQPAGGSCPTYDAVSNSIANVDLVQNKVTRKYLSKITFKRSGNAISYVDFLSVANSRLDLNDLDYPGERLLSKVQLYQRDGFGSTFSLKREFQLFHSYFEDPQYPGQAYGKRLRLDSVQEKPVVGTTPTKPPHRFEYFMSTGATHPLGLDHWGYSNAVQNTTLVPNVFFDNAYYGLGADRNVVTDATKFGVIKRIVYPTGGFTEFDWEGHRALDLSTGEISVGGLRIKKVTDWINSTQRASVRRYKYMREDGFSSGETSVPNYISFSSRTKYAELCYNSVEACCYNHSEIQYTNWTVSASPLLGLGSVQGSHIGYSRVVEEVVDTSELNALGSTVYEYNIEGFDPNDDHVSNGDLLRVTVFDNSGKVLKETTNEYQVNNVGSVLYRYPAIEQVQDNNIRLCKSTVSGVVVYSWRPITIYYNETPACEQTRYISTRYNFGGHTVNRQEKFMTRQTQRVYDQKSNAYLESVKNFTYGSSVHMMPTRIEQTSTTGEVVVSELKYPLDYNTSVINGTPAQGIHSLKNANIVAVEIENLQFRQNPDGSNKRLINGVLTFYEKGLAIPTKQLRIETEAPLTGVSASTINASGQLVYHVSYKPFANYAYDNTYNIIEQSKEKDMPVSYVWDYLGVMPSAEAKNALSTMIAYTSFESDNLGNFTSLPNLTSARISGGFSGGWGYSLTGNTITKSGLASGRTYVISYWSKSTAATVSAGGSSVTLRTDVAGSHLGWTYYEHLVTNPGTISITGAVVIDELRIYPADGEMSTSAFVSQEALPVTAIGPNNERTAFEYDIFGRLLNVRDDDNNIVKNYVYQYGTGNTVNAPARTLYYSSPAQGTFSRQGCVSPAVPLPIVYAIPYGKYAAITQIAANTLANTDITSNGQTYANTNGRCVVYNVVQSQVFYKNNCSYEQGPPTCHQGVTYTVPGGTYYANTLTEANQMALNDIAANGQNYANQNCGCSCSALNQKYINGSCETGVMMYSGFEYIPGCSAGKNYRCYYYFQFSDGSVTPTYSMCTTAPCVPQ